MHEAKHRTVGVHLEDALDLQAPPKTPLTDPVTLDTAAEKRLLRKLDLHVIPILWLLFMLAFLDRTNIGKLDPGHTQRGIVCSGVGTVVCGLISDRQCKDPGYDRGLEDDGTGLQYRIVHLLWYVLPFAHQVSDVGYAVPREVRRLRVCS